MKNLIVLLFAGVLFPSIIFGQVTVRNATRSILEVNGTSVPIGSSNVKVNLPVKNDITSFEVVYFDANGVYQGPVKMYREVKKNGILIADYDPEADLAQSFNSSTGEQRQAPETRQMRTNVASGSWWSTVTVRPENNLEDQSIFVPTEPFLGLALNPGQVSDKTATIRTGKIMFPVMLGAGDEKTMTGMKFTWGLVHKIVAEGEDTLKINTTDIMRANSGKQVRKKIGSLLPFDFMISEGASRGTVVPSKSVKRLELFVGWNILPIQFKDRDGLPTEAILILLVSDQKSTLFARRSRADDQIDVSEDEIRIATFR